MPDREPLGPLVNDGPPRTYWGLGIGLFRSKAEFPTIDLAAAGMAAAGTEDKSDTNLGGRAILGVDFANMYYVGASYNLSGDVADESTNSLALVAGARF